MEKIENLLGQVQIISQKIKEQRHAKNERGENFNIFNDFGLMSDEVRLHSAFVALLLNPRSSHGQKGKYLKAFLEMLNEVDPAIPIDFLDSNSKNVSVQIEKTIGKLTDDDGGRIDIYITDTQHRIIVENKIYAADQNHQMLRYWNYGILRDKNNSSDSFKLIYLTLDGHDPANYSTNGLNKDQFICLSYKYDICKWLERCIELSAQQPLIRETIIQYLNTIKILTNSDMDQNKDLLQILAKEENIDAVFDIMNSRDAFLDYIINEKFIPQLRELAREKGFVLENSKKWTGESWAGGSFYNEDWNYFRLSFEFERRGLGDLIFGFLVKPGIKRRDVADWDKIQTAYSLKDKNNQIWIYKNFIGDRWWVSAQSVKNLLNGKTINDFSQMIDEAVECTRDLKL